MSKVIVNKAYEQNAIRDAKGRIRYYVEKHESKDGNFYVQIKSANSSTNVVWQTPVKDLSSKTAVKKAIASFQKVAQMMMEANYHG